MNRSPKFALTVVCCLATLIPALRSSAEEPRTTLPIDGRPFFWALSVKDVEASSSWYQRVLGFSEVRQIDMPERSARIRLLRTDHAFLELVEHATARDVSEIEPAIEKIYLLRGVFKTGLLVDDLESTLDRLGALNIPLRGIIFTEPDGTFRSAQIEDPDGNVIQLFERLGD